MKKAIVIVTGVAVKEAKKFFKQPNPATIIERNGKKLKMNAPAGAAIELNKAGYLVYMVGPFEESMKIIGETFMKQPYHYKTVDLMDKLAVKEFAKEIETLKKKTKLDVHVAHYGGASFTPVKLPNDNVFLDPWGTPSEAVAPIVSHMTVTWFNLLQGFKSIFTSQKRTKIVFISAITALRTKRLHTLDAIQKGAGHAMARSLALDLTKENIFITEVMPGITDTGFYDNQATYDAIVLASKDLGYDYTNEDEFPVFSAERIGEAVVFVMNSDMHVRELSFMPYGQYPHLGA